MLNKPRDDGKEYLETFLITLGSITVLSDDIAMTLDKKLRDCLCFKMIQIFGYQHDLDIVARKFGLKPPHGSRTTIRSRCSTYSREVPDERFPELAEYVLNKEAEYSEDSEINPLKSEFARILAMYGFKVKYAGGWHVDPPDSSRNGWKKKESGRKLR